MSSKEVDTSEDGNVPQQQQQHQNDAQEIACSREIDRLLEEAARQHNFCYPRALGGRAYYDASEASEAKKKYGSQHLLDMLKQFQCKSEECRNIEKGCKNDPDKDGNCPRLGLVFIPNQDLVNYFEDDEDEEEDEKETMECNNEEKDLDEDLVTMECIGCYESHADDDGFDPLMCWPAESADQYFQFPKGRLKEKLTAGCNRRNWNERCPFVFDTKNPAFFSNQVTWGALRVANLSIFEFYMTLIYKKECHRKGCSVKHCPRCSKRADKTCSRCGVAAYCSRECQRSDWKTHKKTCTPKKK